MGTTLFSPSCLAAYACKLGACRRTCCTGRDWRISMSPEERDRAREMAPAHPGASRFIPLISEPGQGEDGQSIALPMREDGLCALLDKDGSCAWRSTTKSDLCAICRDFPIMHADILGDVYAYPSGACEAVLETLAANDDRLVLRTQPLEQSDAAWACTLTVTPDDIAANRPYDLYPQFAEFALDLLQDETYSLDDRMALLTSCLHTAHTMARMRQAGKIGRALESMRERPRLDAMAAGFAHDARPGNPAPRICAEMLLCCLDDDAYAPYARKILSNLGFSASTAHEGRRSLRVEKPGLANQRRERCRAYLREKEGFLAKVAVSVYLHSLVPVAGPDIWSSARYFALCYATMKFSIVGSFDEKPDDEELIDLLVVLLRAFTHNDGFYRNVLAWIDGMGFTDACDFAKLLRW